jgi:hypothetical protein
MRTIEMNGTAYPIKFGMGFLKKINGQKKIAVDGMPGTQQNVGLRYAYSQLMDGNVETLIDVILLANETEEPRLSRQTVEEFIDDATVDIDRVFDDVMDFLSTSNATKKQVAIVKEAIEKEMAKP